MIKNDKTNIDEKYKRFEKIHDKIKFKAFGKVTIRQRRIPKDKLEVVGKDTATELLEAQQKRAQSEIEDIEKTKGGKVRKVWEILFQVITLSKYVLKIIVHYSLLDSRSNMVITDLLPGAPWMFLLAVLCFFSSSLSFLMALHPVYISV